jgi:hypothetical protein
MEQEDGQMTTTELITMLQKNEKGGITGKPRVISIQIGCDFFPIPNIVIASTGDGIAGPEICLKIVGRLSEYAEEDEVLDELITKKQALDIISANDKSDKMTLACYDDLVDQIYNAVSWKEDHNG